MYYTLKSISLNGYKIALAEDTNSEVPYTVTTETPKAIKAVGGYMSIVDADMVFEKFVDMARGSSGSR